MTNRLLFFYESGCYNLFMTEKMKRHCYEYLIDGNITQSAIRAGYSKKTASSIGSENLKKPECIEYIEKLKEDIVEDKERIILENLLFWENIRRNSKSEGNRLKASEYLGRYSAMFTDKVEANVHGKIGLNISELTDEELEARLKKYDKG